MSFKESELDYSQTRLSREFNNFFINRKPPNDPAINGFNYLFFTSPDLPLSQAAFANKNIKYKDITIDQISRLFNQLIYVRSVPN